MLPFMHLTDLEKTRIKPAKMMKECLQFLIEPAKKLKLRLKVQFVLLLDLLNIAVLN